ncbi:unnamed protein product [Clonostachys byssicola]|uniref:Carrier domain-containing protein n=1 Tax=Clonostachys byssicola TaxID=160290 RepID=A0A9N9XX22_9HYPO|nr:unnamed protein product [Clonostachys byssicola]
MDPESLLAGELSDELLQLYQRPLDEVRHSPWVSSPCLPKAVLLQSIPAPSHPSFRPLHLLYVALSELPGPWPTFELVKCHTRVSKYLPDSARSGEGDQQLQWLVDATSQLVKRSYGGIGDFLGDAPRPALLATDSRSYITHQGLSKYVANFRLPTRDAPRKPTVAIALPNGPLLAATCVAVATHYTAAPINPVAGQDQFRADVENSGASLILTTLDDCEKLGVQEWAPSRGVEIVVVDWDQRDGIALRSLEGRALACSEKPPEPNRADDIALILFTSGTSGTKKIVPITVHSMIAGILFVMESWGLTETDVCLNMMPLYHVGGLIRNIFAPLFSGGSTICCSAFDPNMFWDVVEELHPTWYYASPSMHSVILEQASTRQESLEKSRIRLACNAAGGLLPSLACQLRDTFSCVVLPSYGMTECMPISTPPLDYKLDREGTSGISTGPELAILDWNEGKVECGTVGRICVRGEPVFPGYLMPDGTYDKSPFNKHGWFDTGDLGYMDPEGYLYITGRSKEVINRGGELISPFEVENAILSASISAESPIQGRISQVLAFSARHDVLQEVVAVVLVTPPKVPRVDLRTLHTVLRSSLQQVKWPMLVVYMDDLPKKNNKVLRISLSQRLKLPGVSDETNYLARHWEARCPPPDTALSVGIPSKLCPVDPLAVYHNLKEILPQNLRHYYRNSSDIAAASLFIAPCRSGGPALDPRLADTVKSHMAKSLHNYLVPDQVQLMKEPLPTLPGGEVDEKKLDKAINELQEATLAKLTASVEGRVTKAFADVLGCRPDDVFPNADFFSLGGDSLRAGRLVSLLRTTFNVHLSINLIFNHGTVKAIASHIEGLQGEEVEVNTKPVGCAVTHSSTNPFLMLLQLFPMVVAYPLRRALHLSIFMLGLSYTQGWPTNNSLVGRLLNLTISLLFSGVVMRAFTPFVGILAKWLIIGRYREGLYPMWGLYHTRWWLVEKIHAICGLGFFTTCDATMRMYYRLMGARIGKDVKLSKASLGEWDLLDIRDGATLAGCICRPFAAEGNTSMYLGRITVGEKAYVGTSSIVAAGSVIPANTCIGPNSSSWELDDADESNRGLGHSGAPKPHWLLAGLFTFPLSVVGNFAAMMPWFAGLLGMVIDKPAQGSMAIRAILNWFTDADRVGYHYLALVLRSLLSPFIIFGFTVLVKLCLDVIFGQMTGGPAEGRGAIATWRASLIKTLLPERRLHDVTALFGQHYEATSVAIRMLGGKIGKRVYWPGTGPSIGDYHLLDIGNDVVFGSRSHLVTSDKTGSEKVIVRDRAMIADRVCLLPGVDVGERTVMGSGALTKRGALYPSDGTYVGSKGGDSVCLAAGREKSTIRFRAAPHHSRNGSETTLEAGEDVEQKREPRSQVQHMSSDDTLAETRRNSAKKSHRTSERYVGSDSETERSSSEASNDSSPFGRAFHMKIAPYHVFGHFAIFCYSSFLTVFASFFWNVPSISAAQVVDVIVRRFVPQVSFWYDWLGIFLLNWVVIAIITTLHAVLAVAIVIAAKWILLGRRMPGNYDWDKSPYCQRWQLFLSIEKIRRQCYRGKGVLGMLTGTHWTVMYFRAMGAKIGKDCALFANGRPSLAFTEPDLISLGDRVVVDDASVVAHINTRGKFDLNRLEIGDRCVLRTGSRLLSGATMKNDSCLLEHTLIMGGDVVEANQTMQGWPAERFKGQRVKCEAIPEQVTEKA